MRRLAFRGILLFLALLSTTLAASPTSFCKCTCFTDSTIIPLSGQRTEPDAGKERAVTKGTTCNDCTKKFCLDYHLPICKGATEADVFTTCFQRDSVKDQVVVLIFIFATVSLLIWAAIKPWADKWIVKARSRHSHVQVSGDGTQ